MSEHAWRLIAPLLEPIALPRDFLISASDERVDYVYFPDSGIGSVTLNTDIGLTAEAGLFGREGFSPTVAAVGGSISMHDIVMQSPGEGHRIDRETLSSVLDEDRQFERMLLRYSHVFATQISYTALANAGNRIDVRLARWLLMCHDRAEGNEFHLTHGYIAIMLAVRRSSVTVALHELEGKHFIRSERNHIIIKDRAGLQAYAGDAYGGPEKEYRMLLGASQPNVQGTQTGASVFNA